MGKSTLVMIGLAVIFGVLAVFAGQSWLTRRAEQQRRELEAGMKPVITETLVVAAQPLRYGSVITDKMLKEVPWPAAALPDGAFRSVADVLKDGARVVITAIEKNEPILQVKVTGPGQRATLSSRLRKGMTAVTLRSDDVHGVAGFVLPGDHVDLIATRRTSDGSPPTTDVLASNVRVLAIDQNADERSDRPAPARAITLEVETEIAPKVALAGQLGNITFLLRKAGETDLLERQALPPPAPVVEVVDVKPEEKPTSRTVNVIRGTERRDYAVPIEVKP